MNQIFVFSGDDLVSSRKAFLEHLENLQKKGVEVVKFQGKELTEEKLELLNTPTSLFGDKRIIVIENLLSGTKSKDKENSLKLLATRSQAQFGEVVVIWEGKDFTKSDQLKYPTGFIFKNYKLPQETFRFLETLSPGKTAGNLQNFHKTLATVDPNFLFLMLIRQIRLLIMAKDNKQDPKTAPWQAARLKKQADLFVLDHLLEINRRLLAIDYAQKTSASPFSLDQELELLLTEI